MRRLVLLVSAMAIVQTLFFSALAPLLPSFERDFALSKGQAGLLVGMFPVGLGVAALPLGLLAARLGAKRAALGGLVALAGASAAFGLVDSYGGLLATRFLQGAAGAICWSSALAWVVETAPRARRGALIGVFSGASAAGQVLGPAVGGLAVLVSRPAVFAGVAGFGMLVAIVGARFPGAPTRGRQPLSALRTAHASRPVLGGHWLLVLPSLLLGTTFVLAPLQLDHLGWGPVGIAGTFLVAAAVGVLARPLVGRWADRRGLVDSLRLLLLAPIPATLAIPWVDNRWLLSACVVVAVSAFGVLIGPAMALVSHAYEERGVAQPLGFALISLNYGVGAFLGSAVGGDIAHLAGDATAYGLSTGACVATFAALALRRSPGLLVDSR